MATRDNSLKILLLGFSQPNAMPYAEFHLNEIDYDRSEVTFVYWNRSMAHIDLSKFDKRTRFLEFRDEMDDFLPKRKKISHFLRYRRFVTRLLRREKFDRIVILHTMPGILTCDWLVTRYRKRYVFDYRDMTYESNSIFGRLISAISRNSILTLVSSDSYRRFLPTKGVEIIPTHNLLRDSLNHRDDRAIGYIPCEKVRISFWGMIRHPEHNKLIIDRLGNDSRFELHYYGWNNAPSKELQGYCRLNGTTNVFFHGAYEPEERYQFALKTDIIHNSYYDANMMIAMGNKYYDGIIFRIPQLCMLGSYMGERSQDRGIGFMADPCEPDYADKVYEYYTSLDWETFKSNCDRELDVVLSEYDKAKQRLREALMN